MGAVSSFVRSLRVLAQLAAGLAVVMTLLAPSALPVARALARQFNHVCKCGMRPGECGCPECARLERELSDREPAAVLKPRCDDSSPALQGGSLPMVLAADAAPRLAVGTGQLLASVASPFPDGAPSVPPPTPPPRTVS